MSMPDNPPPGGRPRPQRHPAGLARPRQIEPVRYVAGLLLGQGVAWLVLAGTGLGFWLGTLSAGLGPGSTNGDVLWEGARLLGIAAGACLGAAQLAMYCKLRGGPRWVLRMAAGLHGVSLAAGLVVVAVLVMIAGSVLELLALSGAF
jgi:hypothetical protein